MEPLSTPRVRKIFRQIADTLIHEGDLFGVVSTGPSAIAIDMTYDRALLKVAEAKIMGTGMSFQDIMTQMDGARGPAETLYLAHSAFKTAHEVVRNLEFVENRRKAFVYFSTGYDFDPFPQSRLYGRSRMDRRSRGLEFDPGGDGSLNQSYDAILPSTDPFAGSPSNRFLDADLQIELSELARAANRSNVSFYAIDPRGLMAGPSIADNIQLDQWNLYVAETQDTLRVLAQLTGGLALVNMNDFESGLKRIDAETSDYYVLGYYTNNPDPTIRTRRIEVNIDRDDVTIQHRSRYSFPLPPPGAVAER
jgi:VWFA-related protein